jgi:hypothetical protein
MNNLTSTCPNRLIFDRCIVYTIKQLTVAWRCSQSIVTQPTFNPMSAHCTSRVDALYDGCLHHTNSDRCHAWQRDALGCYIANQAAIDRIDAYILPRLQSAKAHPAKAVSKANTF